MKKTLLAIAIIGLTLNLDAQELPKTQIKELYSGKKIAFNEIFEKNKVTLISFWGTWCVPGKREVRTIAGNMADWKKQADFNYIAIAIDQHNEDLARKYARAHGWSFPCYIDPNSDLKRPLNFLALPFIMIIDKRGKVVFTHTGYDDGTLIMTKLKEFAGMRSSPR
jgi:thiol-disulfide isomerase/thioredoxin